MVNNEGRKICTGTTNHSNPRGDLGRTKPRIHRLPVRDRWMGGGNTRLLYTDNRKIELRNYLEY